MKIFILVKDIKITGVSYSGTNFIRQDIARAD